MTFFHVLFVLINFIKTDCVLFLFFTKKIFILLLSHTKISFKHMNDIITPTVRKAFFMRIILVNIVEGY